MPDSDWTGNQPAAAGAVTGFWESAGPQKWFAKDPAFDAELRRRFLAAHLAAAARRLDGWARDAQGALALMVLLDQFPRNAFRDTAHMYATDPLARMHAAQAIRRGLDRQVAAPLRPFFYLPFEHSEDPADQERSVALCQDTDPDTLRWARLHRDIIARFGRFPHRNAVLGRDTTAQEQAFLDSGGFSG